MADNSDKELLFIETSEEDTNSVKSYYLGLVKILFA